VEQNFEINFCKTYPINDKHFCLQPNIKKVLVKCRKLVKYFKSLQVRNPNLQKHVIEGFNKEFKFILYCETRWNSLVPTSNDCKVAKTKKLH
jgi:hypothetical protein